MHSDAFDGVEYRYAQNDASIVEVAHLVSVPVFLIGLNVEMEKKPLCQEPGILNELRVQGRGCGAFTYSKKPRLVLNDPRHKREDLADQGLDVLH